MVKIRKTSEKIIFDYGRIFDAYHVYIELEYRTVSYSDFIDFYRLHKIAEAIF